MNLVTCLSSSQAGSHKPDVFNFCLTLALVGSAFVDNQEPAFSNLRMFQALGFTVGYLYSNHLCEYIKLYIVAAELVVSVTLVAVVEIRLRRNPAAPAKVI